MKPKPLPRKTPITDQAWDDAKADQGPTGGPNFTAAHWYNVAYTMRRKCEEMEKTIAALRAAGKGGGL